MCSIGSQKVQYLGYALFDKGVCTQEKLVRGVEKWPTLKDIKKVLGFLGIAGFYRTIVNKLC